MHDLDRLLPIARSMARRQSRRLGLDPDGCESAAYLACWRACQSYREGGGTLSGWVCYKIRHALADHVRSVLGLRRKRPVGRRHDLDDTARLDCRGNEVSYRDLASVSDGDTLGEADSFRHLLGKLPLQEYQTLEIVYGEGCMQKEAAERLGLSPSRITQIHDQAIERLRRTLRCA